MRNVWIIALLCLCGVSASAAQKLSYVDLVKRLTDLESLAVLPVEGERCAQWSSWDRASSYDHATGQYTSWDANGDGQGIIRKEGENSVLAEMEGPGCIWRIWSASPKAGHVKIYLDGSPDPAVDLPFSGYFDLKNEPFAYPSLVYNASSGRNCYIPIPYAKSCRIVAEPGWGNYYHFNYSTFPKGTVLPTFRRELAPEERGALEAADGFLGSQLGGDPARKRTGEATQTKRVILGPGTASTIRLAGPRAVTCIRVKVDEAAVAVNPDSLREAVIRAFWDGENSPSVWSPLIDFFGTAPNANRYRSLPAGVTEDGFYSFWYMPFAKEGVVEFSNDGGRALPIEIAITSAPLSRDIRELGRFHAKWHRDAFLPDRPDRWLDWTMLATKGRGRMVGMAMHLYVPTGGWWGEGDEKFFVDGEKLPSIFGTGSEDYFGYAWGNPALFQHAYHSQTRSDDNAGHVALNRWHITDNVPFQKSFEGCIEKYRSNARPALYSCTAYWYLAPGGMDAYRPVPVSERIGYCVLPGVLTLEGEKMGIKSITGGETVQTSVGGLWSEGSNFEWRGAKPGDELVFQLPAKALGGYKLILRLTRSPDYGTVQVMWDGQALGEPIDLHADKLQPDKEFRAGILDLTSGEHLLGFKLMGEGRFGLDYVKLAPERK